MSRHNALPTTGLSIPQRDLSGGRPVPPRTDNIWEEGTVETANPVTHTYRVRVDGAADLENVPRILNSPGDYELLPEGTRVLVCRSLPKGPTIMGVLGGAPDKSTRRVTEDSTDASNELIPGDRVMRSPDGNFFGALTGGMNVMRSSGMAQIRTYDNDRVDFYAHTFYMLTAFGETRITRTGNEVNYSIRGGANMRANSGYAVKDASTFRVDAGAEGDMLDVRVTTPLNKVLSRFHMGSDGSMSVEAKNSRMETIAGSDVKVVTGQEVSEIVGTVNRRVTNKVTDRLGSYELDLDGTYEVSVGGARLETVVGNDQSYVAAAAVRTVEGTNTLTTQNSSEHVIAPVYSTSPPPVPPAFASWINYSGGYNFVIQPTALAGSFNVVSSLPGSVNLGVDVALMPAVYNQLTGQHTVVPIPAPFGVVMFEQLATWLSSLLSWMDTHVHGTAVGPTTNPVAPAGPTLSPQLPTFRSTRVAVGG